MSQREQRPSVLSCTPVRMGLGLVLPGGCWRVHSGTSRSQASTKLLKSVATEVLKLCELVPIQADIVPLADIRVLLHTLRDKATPSRPRFHLLLH